MNEPQRPNPESRRFRIAVLASGRGSNFVALADAIARGDLGAELVGVFSDRPSAAVLQHAAERGVATWSARAADYPDRDHFDAALFAAVAAVQPDLIVCAGYMRIIGDSALTPWSGRMINIHPSLLPAYPGLHTHRRALQAGDREHGASVHFVSAELDGGPLLAQVRVPVRTGDDETALAQRVLAREHPLLLASVQALASGRAALCAGRVHWNGQPLAAPLQLDAHDQLQVAA